MDSINNKDIKEPADLLADAREKVAKALNIDLSEPKQEKRIKALEKLYDRYASEISIQDFIHKDIAKACDELMAIYEEKQQQLDDLRSRVSENTFSTMKINLENINYKYGSVVRELENRISFNENLLFAYKSKYVNNEGIDSVYRKKLKELEDICWDNWLKALDVNKELRNTIIGFENRKTLLEISKAYIDYFILADLEVTKCLERLKDSKKDGILEYYDILSMYKLPLDKKIDFKLFLQKKIESKFSDAMEIKTMFGQFARSHRSQIDSLIDEVRSQYTRDQMDIISIINHYKKSLMNKQVLFTSESEKLIIYFKRRYIEKIDLLCSRFQIFSSSASATNRKIHPEDLKLLRKIIDEDFQSRVNRLKIHYSKTLIPFLDNFWHLEQNISQEYSLDEENLRKKLKDLKISKNLGLKGLISEFEAKREKIKQIWDVKTEILADVGKIGIREFDVFLKELRDDCDVLCCEIINLNARFWTKANAQFNCEARKHLIRLRGKYAPYLNSWRAGSKPWMNEYLIINLNQELLRAVGEALDGFSPESELYLVSSKALLQFNEKTRKFLVRRDKVELEQLLALNTLPVSKSESLSVFSSKKRKDLQNCCDSFWSNYNQFYNSLLSNG